MNQLLTQFLDHLRYERNVSAHTLRNYESDLTQFFDFLVPSRGEAAEKPVSGRPSVSAVQKNPQTGRPANFLSVPGA
jgi:site-specific recombinase XerD